MDGEREGWVDNKWMYVYGQLVTGNEGRVKDGFHGSWKGKDRWINGMMEGGMTVWMDGGCIDGRRDGIEGREV